MRLGGPAEPVAREWWSQNEDQELSAEQWRKEADRLAAEGNYREALRCRYRALVAELADRRLIDQVPGRTSGDYDRAVRALVPEVAEQFSSVTRLFERCWYGHEASDANAQVVFDEAARAVLAEVGSGRWRAVANDAEQGTEPACGPQMTLRRRWSSCCPRVTCRPRRRCFLGTGGLTEVGTDAVQPLLDRTERGEGPRLVAEPAWRQGQYLGLAPGTR